MAGGPPLSPRSILNSSPLVRLLADLDPVAVVDSPHTFAERLSHWLDWTDAIPLSAALSAASAASEPRRRAAGAAAARCAVVEALDDLRQDLTRAITGDRLLASQRVDVEEGFAPLRRQIQQHQRAMAARIGTLRAQVRAALEGAGAELARLAALDAALERALGPREQQLLASLPARLERHVERRPTPAFAPPIQGVLLAELELRLQPIVGLIEALDHPTTPVLAPEAVGQP
jgi:Protein of unknown function (DUF3348)